MTALRSLWRRQAVEEEPVPAALPPTPVANTPIIDLKLAPDDPLITYLQNVSGVVEMERLTLDSPGLQTLRNAGVRLVLPLVSHGELIGLVNLGPRLSEQDYSSDDRKLLGDLAVQAAPALRVAQLARQQQIEAAQRERLEQELRVARLIQQTLLPDDVPHLDGWAVNAHYQPARAVGGDFYDFIYYPDGKVGFIIGDVTDKGVPAALVMATTRSLLRAAAERLIRPGEVLERTNELLHDDIPAKMFVTCFYGILDPATGHMRYANAGHDVPYRRSAAGIRELRATGMPLGLLPGMHYEEKEATLEPGETLLLYSDGLVEAHSPHPERDMFGFPRLQNVFCNYAEDRELVPYLLDELSSFTGPEWEQEDDVTLVILKRAADERVEIERSEEPVLSLSKDWETLSEFEVASVPGNERQVMEKIAELVAPLDLAPSRLERLKTAVAEATMNAMEHGNKYRADTPVNIVVKKNARALAVTITDQGGGQPIVQKETPDLLAKLAGEQSPRGWGLFLIKNMVDEMNIHSDESHHTLELILHLGDDV
jgi:serine phosphatase RsbU (regulator of sigma subunit)/anti-sigma regulatory factor (Ser/Thr protein kinase)